MKILHTGDIHLGARFIGCLEGGRLRRQLEVTFRKIIDKAIEERVGLFLIAGDLFDSSSPTQSLLDFVKGQFQRLKNNGIEICYIPGTHDQGVRVDGIIQFQNPEWEYKEFGDVTVYGINPTQEFPLRSLTKKTDTKYHIALLHASFHIPDKTMDECLVTKEDIANCQMDYIALGHWHNLCQYGKAWFCGSPEPISIDDIDSGNIIILEDMNPKPYRIGSIKCLRLEIDVNSDIKEIIRANSGQNTRLKVILKGISNLIDIDELKEEFQDSFAQLEIVDKTVVPREKLNPEEYNDKPIIKRFIELMQEEIKNDNPIAQYAMQYGLALLEGKKEI